MGPLGVSRHLFLHFINYLCLLFLTYSTIMLLLHLLADFDIAGLTGSDFRLKSNCLYFGCLIDCFGRLTGLVPLFPLGIAI